MFKFSFVEIFLLLIFSPFLAAQDTQQDPVDKTLSSRVAEKFYEFTVNGLADTIKGAQESTSKIGHGLTPQEFDDQAFYLCNIKELQLKATPEISQLERFLKKNGFLRRIGQITVDRLVNQRVDRILQPFQQSVKRTVTKGAKLGPAATAQFLLLDSVRDEVFDTAFDSVVFPRVVPNPEEIENSFRWYFTPNEEVKRIFAEANALDQKFRTEITKLKIAWSIAEKNWDTGRSLILDRGYGPALFRPICNVDKLCRRKKLKNLVKELPVYL